MSCKALILSNGGGGWFEQRRAMIFYFSRISLNRIGCRRPRSKGRGAARGGRTVEAIKIIQRQDPEGLDQHSDRGRGEK